MSIQPFRRIDSVAAPIMEDNVDTDVIYPARFLLITARDGLGRYAFHDRRFTPEGAEVADFVLNQHPWRGARILITGANFGSGSSREQAVWALLGQGITCIVGRSFGEIFFNNCFRNGVLPIILPAQQIDHLAAAAERSGVFAVDLDAQTIEVEGKTWPFDIEPERKQALLNGWDETAMILNAHGSDIDQFEAGQRRIQPWLYEKEPAR